MFLKLAFPMISWHQRPVFHMRLVKLYLYSSQQSHWSIFSLIQRVVWVPKRVLKMNGNLATSLYILGNVTNGSMSQSGLDWVAVGGSRTRCSSILLDWERIIRLKKSSSGMVGPFVVETGAAHRWSFSLDPWHLTSMSKKTSSPSGCSALASMWS